MAASTLFLGALALLGGFDDFGNGAISFQQVGTEWKPALFICDGTDHPQTMVFTLPAANGDTVVTTLADGGSTSRLVTLGAGDPGAGQVIYPISGSAKGMVHAFNPAMVDGATSPTVSSVTMDGQNLTCRWAPGTVLMAVTPVRTVLITATAPGYQYQAFTHGQTTPVVQSGAAVSNVPALSLSGGTMTGDAQSQSYSFTNGDYSYTVAVGGPQGKPGGTLTIRHGADVVGVEQITAYTLNGN